MSVWAFKVISAEVKTDIFSLEVEVHFNLVKQAAGIG